MLVCHCNGVSDRTIRKVVRSGAETPAQVARACGAGAGCGGCVEAVRDLIHSECEHRVEGPLPATASPSANA